MHRFLNWLGRYALLLGCLAFFGAFLLFPIALTIKKGFVEEQTSDQPAQFTLRYVTSVFADPVLREAFSNSLLIAVSVTFLCIIIAVPLAMLAHRYRFPGKKVFSSLLLVPLILPPFVGAIGLRQLLGRFGAINSLLIQLGVVDASDPIDFLGGARFWGVVLMEALHLYPIVYLNASAALANLDPAMEQAAENLGAGLWQRLRRIVIPLILPGLFAGCTIVFIWSFTELGTPLMFDYYQVAPVQVFWGIQELDTNPRPYAIVFVMVAISVSLYVLAKLAFGGKGHAMTMRAMTGDVERRLNWVKGLIVTLPFLLITGLAIMPHIGVILTSLTAPGQWYQSPLPETYTLDHFRNMLTHPLACGSIHNSLLYAFLATLINLTIGFAIAWLCVRTKTLGRQSLDALAMMPLAVPGLVLAFGYVGMTLSWPIRPIVDWAEASGYTNLLALLQVTGGGRVNPLLFLVIAYAVRRLPYVVRSATAGLEQVSVDLEDAAANLGAKHTYTIRRILVPLIAPNLIAGGLLAFSFAMLEVSDSLILAQSEEHYPLTKAVYVLFQRLGDGPYLASAMGVWGMALLTVTLVAASVLLGKKLGAIFRV